MREYKSPVGFEGLAWPISGTLVRLLLALLALALTAVMWFGVGAKGTWTGAQRMGLLAAGAPVVHVTLPPVVVVGRRDQNDSPAIAARASDVDCARTPAAHSGARNSG